MSPAPRRLAGLICSPGWLWEVFGFLSKTSNRRDARGVGGRHQQNKFSVDLGKGNGGGDKP